MSTSSGVVGVRTLGLWAGWVDIVSTLPASEREDALRTALTVTADHARVLRHHDALDQAVAAHPHNRRADYPPAAVTK